VKANDVAEEAVDSLPVVHFSCDSLLLTLAK